MMLKKMYSVILGCLMVLPCAPLQAVRSNFNRPGPVEQAQKRLAQAQQGELPEQIAAAQGAPLAGRPAVVSRTVTQQTQVPAVGTPVATAVTTSVGASGVVAPPVTAPIIAAPAPVAAPMVTASVPSAIVTPQLPPVVEAPGPAPMVRRTTTQVVSQTPVVAAPPGQGIPAPVIPVQKTVTTRTTEVDLEEELEGDKQEELDLDVYQEEGVTEPRVVEEEEEVRPVEINFNIDRKRKDVVHLVERGMEYLKRNKPSEAFRAFTHSNDFIKGELYLFVFDGKGVCLAHGQQSDLLWKNLYELRDQYGTPMVKNMLTKAAQGGGWLTYFWRNATKVSYVQQVKKGDQTFIVGAGYYPHSKENAVVNLVKGAVALFNDYKASGRLKEEAFSTFSYPMGRFIYGDLYLYALDFKGTIMAQGDRPGLIGTNAWDYRDSRGRYTNQEIIKRLKETPQDEGIWVTYMSKRALKKVYAEKVEDARGNFYVIACGYYPEATREEVVNLVKKGYQYMKQVGKSVAASDFTSKSNDRFRYGDLALVVYDYKGVCIANGNDPEYVGQNHFTVQDEDGRYYIQELIHKGQAGGGWVDIKIKNSFQSMYVESVEIGLERYIIACGIFPISKADTVNLLVRSGASFLKTNDDLVAFQEFTKKDGRFIRGDLDLFVYNTAGICYADGDDYKAIWEDRMNAKDDTGKPYVTMMINAVQRGPNTVSYTLNRVPLIAAVDKVEKPGRTFIIGSSFYT